MATVELTVFAHLEGEAAAVPAGNLRLTEEGSRTLQSRFIYGARYLERANRLEVDPISLPIGAGARTTGWSAPVNGLPLFGAIRDATPDLWGRKVIENRLKAPPGGLPESVYLLAAGTNRVGALEVRQTPDAGPAPGHLPVPADLEHLVDAAERIEAGLPVPAHLELFFDGAPTLGGARPKAVVGHEGREWVAKFPLRSDRFDIPTVERSTLELARMAGMVVPETRLITLADDRNVMLIQRFDRRYAANAMTRIHMVSGLTMLGKDESDLSGAYAELSDAIGRYGASGHVEADRAELYRRMVFNILVSNDDDHLRNHAFLWDGGGWRLSPLYDVLPKPQAATERHLVLGVGDEGRSATLRNALSRCQRFGLDKPSAARIIDDVARVVREWRVHFEGFGCSAVLCDRVQTAFRRPLDVGMREVEVYL